MQHIFPLFKEGHLLRNPGTYLYNEFNSFEKDFMEYYREKKIILVGMQLYAHDLSAECPTVKCYII